ncbi:DUF488 domain-containing protein [Phormidium nigroviride]
MAIEIFTVGHSNLSIEAFISLLKEHEITAIADVRSHPYSRYLPHFNKSEIKASLSSVGIQYVFLGKELGARPEDLSCYDVNGKALYERIAATQLFAEGIQRLIKGAESYKLTLMCAEKDPITCHRTILVCRELTKLNVQIAHILSDSSLESQEQLEKRLLSKFNKGKDLDGPIQLSLFELEPQFKEKKVELAEAYHRQGLEIAYVNKEKN